MFTANIVKMSIGYPQEWMAKGELDRYPSKYPGGKVKQDVYGTGLWFIVREKNDEDYKHE